MRIGLTVRAPGAAGSVAAEKARAALSGLEGVREVEVLEPAEAGARIAERVTFSVGANACSSVSDH